MTDPAKIGVDENATYVRISGYGTSASSIPNPLTKDESREWNGHAKENATDGDDSRLEVDDVSRGGWGFLYVETDDQELIDALEREGHEPLTPDEFAATFDNAPEFTYLRTPSDRTAKRAKREFRNLSTIELDEIIELEGE